MIRADVLYIGYPRAGSTYLRGYFRDHPQINYDDQQIAELLYQPAFRPVMIDKPPGKVYISCDESISESVCVTGDSSAWGKYLYRPGCFNLVRHDVVLSPHEAVRRMKRVHPRAKILMMIRDQVDWFESLYKATLTSLPPGQRTFHDYWITPAGIAMRAAAHHDVVIHAWMEAYDDVLVIRYEELMGSAARLCRWLGVAHVLFHVKRVNESHAGLTAIHRRLPFLSALPHGVKSMLKPLSRFIPGKRKAVLQPKDRDMIREHYEASNDRTRRILEDLQNRADHPALHHGAQLQGSLGRSHPWLE